MWEVGKVSSLINDAKQVDDSLHDTYMQTIITNSKFRKSNKFVGHALCCSVAL